MKYKSKGKVQKAKRKSNVHHQGTKAQAQKYGVRKQGQE